MQLMVRIEKMVLKYLFKRGYEVNLSLVTLSYKRSSNAGYWS